jgi:hypothetical protein
VIRKHSAAAATESAAPVAPTAEQIRTRRVVDQALQEAESTPGSLVEPTAVAQALTAAAPVVLIVARSVVPFRKYPVESAVAAHTDWPAAAPVYPEASTAAKRPAVHRKHPVGQTVAHPKAPTADHTDWPAAAPPLLGARTAAKPPAVHRKHPVEPAAAHPVEPAAANRTDWAAAHPKAPAATDHTDWPAAAPPLLGAPTAARPSAVHRKDPGSRTAEYPEEPAVNHTDWAAAAAEPAHPEAPTAAKRPAAHRRHPVARTAALPARSSAARRRGPAEEVPAAARHPHPPAADIPVVGVPAVRVRAAGSADQTRPELLAAASRSEAVAHIRVAGWRPAAGRTNRA